MKYLPVRKRIAVLLVFPLVLVLAAAANLRAQQTNLLVLMPPSLDASPQRNREISGSCLGMHGKDADINGLDLSVVIGEMISSSTRRSYTLGSALIGEPGKGDIYPGSVKKDLVGMTLHASADKLHFAGGGSFLRRILFTSIPFSVGCFNIGSKKDAITVYNVLTGFQGGAALNVSAGDFAVTPSVMVSVLGGYKERYKGGVYWGNMNSGGVRPFGVVTAGFELGYVPKRVKLSGIYQRVFSSGDNKAMDSLLLRLTLGFELLTSKTTNVR